MVKVTLLLATFDFYFTCYLNSLSQHVWMNSVSQHQCLKNNNTKCKKNDSILQQRVLTPRLPTPLLEIYKLLYLCVFSNFPCLVKVATLLCAFDFYLTFYLNSFSQHEWLNSVPQHRFLKNYNTKYRKYTSILQQNALALWLPKPMLLSLCF